MLICRNKLIILIELSYINIPSITVRDVLLNLIIHWETLGYIDINYKIIYNPTI